MKTTFYFFLINITFYFSSCKTQKANYIAAQLTETGTIQLKTWNLLGAVISNDTARSDYLSFDHLASSNASESAFCKDPYSTKLSINNDSKLKDAFTKRYYKSKDPIIDFTSVCPDNNPTLPEIKGSAIYYYCQVNALNSETDFLLTRSSNGIKVWLNGDSVYQSWEPKGFEVTFSEFIPLKFKKGKNILVVKRVNHSSEWLFEAQLCKRTVAAHEYQKKATLFLLQNPIAKDTLKLLSNFAKDMDITITFSISNLKGETLIKGNQHALSPNFVIIKSLQPQQSYLYHFNLAGLSFYQPFYIGDPDVAFSLFSKQAHVYFGNNPDTTEIGSYIYRLKFLLNHSSRQDDWWWKYKVSSILTEMSNIFHNLEKNQSLYRNSFGIQFRSYKSTLDGNIQRYLLIQPDKIHDKANPMPLVVVLRPHIENNHHFLTSPQLARYWSLTNAKYLANKYGYIIMMPEGRLYLNEPLIPMADAEIQQAIENAQKVCNIDTNRIYLHGNCTAGNRCLTFAGHHPDMFAAIGLYAPLYQMHSTSDWENQNAPETLLSNLNNTPMTLHYDPIDKHSPPSYFNQLISDCKSKKMPLQVSSSRNSGLHYNVLLVGEEAFTFFKDKVRNPNPRKVDLTFFNNKHGSAWWLSGRSLFANKPTRLISQLSENVINLISENVSDINIDFNKIQLQMNRPLTINNNQKLLFFGIPSKKKYTFKIESVSSPIEEDVIADLFAEPFLFVVNQNNKNPYYVAMVDSLKKEYEAFMFCPIPMKFANMLTDDDLKKNLFIVGHTYNDKIISKLIEHLPLKMSSDCIQNRNLNNSGIRIIFQSIFRNPHDQNRKLVIYSSNRIESFQHKICCPWKMGFKNENIHSNSNNTSFN